MEPFQTQNIALFIDFENIHSEEFDVEKLVERLKERGRLIIKKAYADWGRFIRVKQTMMFNSVELVEMPAVGYRGKNSSDIKLTIDALETAFNRQYIDTFVVVSGDSDFTPLISKLRELDRYVIVVSSKDNTSKLLKGYCDELIYLSAICGGKEEELSRQTGYDLLRRAVESLENLRGEARSSLVKSQMVRLDSSFTEENVGFKQFRRFLEQAQRDGVIQLKTLADGEHRVSLPGSDKSAPEPPRKKPPVKPEPAGSVDAAKSRSSSPSPLVGEGRGGGKADHPHPNPPPLRGRESEQQDLPDSAPATRPAAPAPDPERLTELTNRMLLAWSLARQQDQTQVDLNELAHCCKRMEPKTLPERYGVARSRGFKGLVQLVQEMGFLLMNYEADGNHHWISLTPQGQDRLGELARPQSFLEQRYRSLLKSGTFRARLQNEKLVYDALIAFLQGRQDDDRPVVVRDFLQHAVGSLNTLGLANLRHILEALETIGAITLEASGENGNLDDRRFVQVEIWPTVAERITQWHRERLQTETGEPFQRELYLQVLREENSGELLAASNIRVE